MYIGGKEIRVGQKPTRQILQELKPDNGNETANV
jgi:hypothetical protein